ncbi:50S ribosomal protein L4 [bacterium]|nr:50S ribosomal protein L4 [bacterium]
MSKKKVGNVDLSDAVFAAEVRPHLLNDAVRYQIAKRYEHRTANALTRTEVNGTTKKMYKQKGTGQARQGSGKSGHFVGGGKAHGPRPRMVVRKLNKKVKRAALISALSWNQKQDRLFVVDKLELGKLSAKSAAQLIKAFGSESALIVNSNKAEKEQFFNRSLRNVEKVKFLAPEGINVFDILKYKTVIISKSAVQKLSERLANV